MRVPAVASRKDRRWAGKALGCLLGCAGCAWLLTSCGNKPEAVRADDVGAGQAPVVGVMKATRQAIGRSLTISSELVPFQEIDVFAKESGYVSKLLVDYGSHVKKGQLLAVLEIPELQMQLDEDRADLKSKRDQVSNAQHQQNRLEAQHRVLHLAYQRLADVSKSKPGLVAQQEVDDVQGRDLASQAAVDAAGANIEAAQSGLAASEAKLTRDQAVYDYARITAPFTGVVTQRYANMGVLVSSGTNSSTQAMPVVRLSQLDLFRLVIPVPESYVKYVKVGQSVKVHVPALDRDFTGHVARFSYDIHDATRTMHTEVDVPNPSGALLPGLYAEATIALAHAPDALTVPTQVVERTSKQATLMVVDSQNQIQIRNVVLGIETETQCQVLSGLQDGDRVVASDRGSLHAGETVNPREVPATSYGDSKS